MNVSNRREETRTCACLEVLDADLNRLDSVCQKVHRRSRSSEAPPLFLLCPARLQARPISKFSGTGPTNKRIVVAPVPRGSGESPTGSLTRACRTDRGDYLKRSWFLSSNSRAQSAILKSKDVMFREIAAGRYSTPLATSPPTIPLRMSYGD